MPTVPIRAGGLSERPVCLTASSSCRRDTSNPADTRAINSRWTDSILDQLKTVPASAFEAVDESACQISADSAQAKNFPAAH